MKKIINVLIYVVFIGFCTLSVVPYFIKPIPKVEKEYTFNLTPRELFSYFNNIKKFNTWNYWAKKDSMSKITYFFPYSGEKSSFSWESDDSEVGTGSFRINKSYEFDSIKGQMTFNENLQIVQTKIQFKENKDKSTKVKWIIHPPKTTYFGRIYNLYVENFLEDKLDFSFQKLDQIINQKDDKLEKIKVKPGLILEHTTEPFMLFGYKTTVNKDLKLIHSNIIQNKDKIKTFLKDSIHLSDLEIGNLMVYYQEVSPLQEIKKRWSTKIIPPKMDVLVGYKIFDSLKVPEADSIPLKNLKNENILKGDFLIKSIKPQENLVQYYEGNLYDKSKIEENIEDYSLQKSKEIKKFYWEEYDYFNLNDSLESKIIHYQPIK